MLKYQDAMTRQSGCYEIMRRGERGKFGARQVAYWERKYNNTYGEWTYITGEIRAVDERLKDDLVLRSAEV